MSGYKRELFHLDVGKNLTLIRCKSNGDVVATFNHFGYALPAKEAAERICTRLNNEVALDSSNKEALRKAAEFVLNDIHAWAELEQEMTTEDALRAVELQLALQKPPRNCDFTKDFAEESFKKEFGRPWTVEEDEFATWLFSEKKDK